MLQVRLNILADLEVMSSGHGAPQYLCLDDERSDYLSSDTQDGVRVNPYLPSIGNYAKKGAKYSPMHAPGVIKKD